MVVATKHKRTRKCLSLSKRKAAARKKKKEEARSKRTKHAPPAPSTKVKVPWWEKKAAKGKDKHPKPVVRHGWYPAGVKPRSGCLVAPRLPDDLKHAIHERAEFDRDTRCKPSPVHCIWALWQLQVYKSNFSKNQACW